MKNQRVVNVMISIGGMLLLLALAYGTDSLREYTDRYCAETFSHGYEIHWLYVVTNLVLSGTTVLWLWFVLVKAQSEKWVYVVFICIGLLITIYPVLYFTDLGVLYLAYRLSPVFQIYLSSGIIAMAGVLKLIMVQKKL
jgi:hypothetical protein